MRNCPMCGAPLDEEARFCPACGTAVSLQEPTVGAPQYYQSQLINNDQNRFYGYQNGPAPNMGFPPPEYVAVPDSPTISETYSKVFAFFGKKPVLLWGLSLLHFLLCSIALIFGAVPVISIPIILVLNVGVISVFLSAYRGEKISAEQLFLGFKSFLHFCGGMAWMLLWIFLWGLIPVAGIVFAIIKIYAYRFVPYILLTQPDITPSEALRESAKQTEGYRARMFGADLLIVACILAASLTLYLLGVIPYMGILFQIINLIFAIAVCAFAPLVFGTVQAAFYDEISKKKLETTELDFTSV